MPKGIWNRPRDNDRPMQRHIHPRSLDAIAREVPYRWKGGLRAKDPVALAALDDLRGRPRICEAMYPALAVRAARVFLEVSKDWTGKHAGRLKAEILDQIEDYERHAASLRRISNGEEQP